MQLIRLPPFSILLQGRGLITNFLPSIFPVCPWKQFLCSSKIHVSSGPLLGAENTPFLYLVEESPICGYQYFNNPHLLLLVLSWRGKSSALQKNNFPAWSVSIVQVHRDQLQTTGPCDSCGFMLDLFASEVSLGLFYCLVALLSRIFFEHFHLDEKKWRFFFLKNRRSTKTLKYKLRIIYSISSFVVVSAFPGIGKLRNGIYQHEVTSESPVRSLSLICK